MPRTIQVSGLSEEVLNRLTERASQAGIDPASYVRRLIERDMAPPHPGMSFAELLGPMHDYTQARALPDSEINRLLAGELNRTRSARRKSM